MDEELNAKFNNLMLLFEEKTKKKGKSLQFYYKNAIKNKNEKQAYIIDILNSFPLIKNQIHIKNKNYQVFYSKFLDISKQIIEDDNNQVRPEIIIKLEDLKKLGKDKDLILQYIKIALFYDEESLKILFYFLNQNFTSLNSIYFHFNKRDDITNIDGLKKSFNDAKIYKTHEKKDINFQIKIILEDDKEKKDDKLKEIKNIKLKGNIQSKEIEMKEKKSKIEEEKKKIKEKSEKKEEKELTIKKEQKIDEEPYININQKKKDNEVKINLTFKGNNEGNGSKNIINIKKDELISSQGNEKIKVNNNNKMNEEKLDTQNDNTENKKQEFKQGQKSIHFETVKKLGIKDNKPIKKIRAKSFKYESINRKIINTYEKKLRTVSEKKNNKINDNNDKLSESTIKLKEGLSFKKVGEYLQEQKKKYLKIYKNNDILNNDYFLKSSFELNFHSSKNSNYLILKKAAQNLKEYFNKSDEYYNNNFGFVILNNIAYFYLNDMEEQENKILFDSEKIKQINYEAQKKIDDKKKEDKKLDDKFSYVSYSSSNKSNSIEDKEVEYQLFNGMQFEKNFVEFFDLSFKLQHLPSVLFSVKIKENKKINMKSGYDRLYSNNSLYPSFSYRNYNYYGNKSQHLYYNNTSKKFKKNNFQQNEFDYKKNTQKFDQKSIVKNKTELKPNATTNSKEIKFKEYINNLFKVYIETDCVRFNDKGEDLKYFNIIKPFIEYEPFKIEKNDKKWVIEEIKDKTLKIYKNSIILVEAKTNAPDNEIYIKLDENIEKNKIQNYLYFVIYKLIKKISYYKELFINEYLKENEDFSLYKFQLFLVYNTQPYFNINDYIKNCLENLIKDELIENEFIFQVLYLIPTMSRYTSKLLTDIIRDNEKEITNNSNKIKILEKKILDLENQIKKNDGEKNDKDK